MYIAWARFRNDALLMICQQVEGISASDMIIRLNSI